MPDLGDPGAGPRAQARGDPRPALLPPPLGWCGASDGAGAWARTAQPRLDRAVSARGCQVVLDLRAGTEPSFQVGELARPYPRWPRDSWALRRRYRAPGRCRSRAVDEPHQAVVRSLRRRWCPTVRPLPMTVLSATRIRRCFDGLLTPHSPFTRTKSRMCPQNRTAQAPGQRPSIGQLARLTVEFQYRRHPRSPQCDLAPNKGRVHDPGRAGSGGGQDPSRPRPEMESGS